MNNPTQNPTRHDAGYSAPVYSVPVPPYHGGIIGNLILTTTNYIGWQLAAKPKPIVLPKVDMYSTAVKKTLFSDTDPQAVKFVKDYNDLCAVKKHKIEGLVINKKQSQDNQLTIKWAMVQSEEGIGVTYNTDRQTSLK